MFSNQHIHLKVKIKPSDPSFVKWLGNLSKGNPDMYYSPNNLKILSKFIPPIPEKHNNVYHHSPPQRTHKVYHATPLVIHHNPTNPFDKFAKNLTGGLGKGFKSIGDGIGKGVKGIGKGFKGIGDGIGKGVNGIGKGVNTIGKGIGKDVNTIGKGIGKGVKAVGKQIKHEVNETEHLVNIGEGLIDNIGKGVAGLGELFGNSPMIFVGCAGVLLFIFLKKN